MSYTIRKLREIEDSAPKFGFGKIQEARFAREDTGLAYHVLRPGRRQGFAHRHVDVEEIYVVLSGAGSLKLDDEVVEIETMDAIRVAPAVTRAFEAGPEGLELLAFGPHHDKDGEIVEDFWGD